MKRTTQATLLTLALLLPAAPTWAADPDPAMSNPDQFSWELFVKANAPAASQGNNNVMFETWAADGDTFTQDPKWPGTTPSPKVLKVPALIARAPRQPGLQPSVLPGGSEEVRRNKTTFDFIVTNKLYLTSGLVAAFKSGTPISFPINSIEVKANWKPVTAGMDTSTYHVNTASDGKKYALVSMHIISKVVPNWTWATFEHKDNAGRCDYMGCSDKFGAVVPFVAPKRPLGGQYPACAKTTALKKMFTDGKLDAVFDNYCLKGSQTDFTDPTGLAVRVGNSVTEKGFVAQSSCMTCHGRAAVDATGKPTTFAGFDLVSASLPLFQNSGNGAVGPINSNWYWIAGGPPSYPSLLGEGDLARIALAADFVWSVPFCAIDDTANPPETTSRFCGRK